MTVGFSVYIALIFCYVLMCIAYTLIIKKFLNLQEENKELKATIEGLKDYIKLSEEEKMIPVKLKYGEEGFEQIEKFLKNNKHEGYTLSIYNGLEKATTEVVCKFDEMVDVIKFVSMIEHDYPEWIGTNKFSDSYVVGMNFTRGEIPTPSVSVWSKDKLVIKTDVKTKVVERE